MSAEAYYLGDEEAWDVWHSIEELQSKYSDLLWRQPNVFHVGIGPLTDGHGTWTRIMGIGVKVTKKVDQDTLPPEHRIPDCLEGVPVEVREAFTREYMNEVRDKYMDLFLSYPYFWYAFTESFLDNRSWQIGEGITIAVREMVDPSTLPPEQRMPSHLDGVPVRTKVPQGGTLIPHLDDVCPGKTERWVTTTFEGYVVNVPIRPGCLGIEEDDDD